MKRTVLLVDDEQEILDILNEAFRAEGYKTINASDGNEAIERLSESRPDLVVLDIMMPNVDGWEVLDYMRKNPSTKDIPVLVLTAKSSEISKVFGLQHGADDYMTKPFGQKELMARCEAILRRTAPTKEREPEATEAIDLIPVNSENGFYFISKDEIVCVEADRKNTIVYTPTERLTSKLNISKMENLLGSGFMRVHRSFIVNLARIKRIIKLSPQEFVIETETKGGIPVSRREYPRLKKALKFGKVYS